MLINRIFYTLKPLIPRATQIFLRRRIALYKRKKYAHIWPVGPNAAKPPEGWNGWPDSKEFAFILTHDVDSQRGHDQCNKLMDLEEKKGFRSSFNFVPERYKVSMKLIQEIKERGFEVGVHGLKHDGKLYSSRKKFTARAKQINHYLRKWNSVGFRSPAMHHNLKWILDLNIVYDASTFDIDPFEPQPEGVGTNFPFIVKARKGNRQYVELPYTLPQDFTLFILLQERNIDCWKYSVDHASLNGGMALLNNHPDYMNFNSRNLGKEDYPARYYSELLDYVSNKYSGNFYNALPKDIARFWLNNVRKPVKIL